MTYEARIQLVPITHVADVEAADDDWLNNDSTDLLSTVDDLKTTSKTCGQQYTVTSLMLKTTTEGCYLKKEKGDIELFSGDAIILGEHSFQVVIEHQMQASSKPVTPSVQPSAVAPVVSGDIWGSDEVEPSLVSVPDPFAQARQSQAFANLPQVPNVHSHDPLNFLYDNTQVSSADPNALLPSVSLSSSSLPQTSTPNYFSDNATTQAGPQLTANLPASGHQGNVLNELGIHQTQVSDTLVTSPVADVMNESPADRLDEYLNFDEHYSQPQPTALSQNTNNDTSALNSMRSLFKKRRT
jgi:hypothetical protein